VVRIDVPPLRKRGEDIKLLAYHFLRKYQEANDKRFDSIDPEALRALAQYHWPGNVRELENVIERAVILSRSKSVSVTDLPPAISGAAEVASVEATPGIEDLQFPEAKAQAIERFERHYLERMMERHQSVTAAARASGLDRSNFRRLLRRHGLLGTGS